MDSRKISPLLNVLTLCLLGDFSVFLSSADLFFKINIFEKL